MFHRMWYQYIALPVLLILFQIPVILGADVDDYGPIELKSGNEQIIRAYLERLTVVLNQRQANFERILNDKFTQNRQLLTNVEEILENLESRLDGIVSVIETQHRNMSNNQGCHNDSSEKFVGLDAKLTQIMSSMATLEDLVKKNMAVPPASSSFIGTGDNLPPTMTPNPLSVSPTMQSTTIPSANTTRKLQCYSVNSGIDYSPGANDLLHQEGIDLGNCCDFCKRTPGCKAFVWSKSRETCWLKSALYPTGVNPDRISGLPENPNDLKNTDGASSECLEVNSGLDYSPGSHDIAVFLNMDLAGCCLKCNSDPSCHAFVWSKTSQMCWLKDVDRPRVMNSDRISGLQNPQCSK